MKAAAKFFCSGSRTGCKVPSLAEPIALRNKAVVLVPKIVPSN